MRMDKGKPFSHVKADFVPEEEREHHHDLPVFSEAFLYSTVGKGDARFILGVADEYEHVIDALGPAAVRAILGVKPRLVQRLGTGEKIVEWLEDARESRDLQHDEQFPPQVILDDNAAEAMWRLLHDEYVRIFDPENDMDVDRLRAYHALTDALGGWEKEQRQKEIDRLPEKLAKKEKRQAEVAAKRERRRRRVDAVTALSARNGEKKVIFVKDDPYGLWVAGDTATYVGPESDHPDAPNIGVFELRDGQVITLSDAFERGLVQEAVA